MSLGRRISTDDWMELLDYVVANVASDGAIDSKSPTSSNVHLFFWQKYCAVHEAVRRYLKKIEKRMFSAPNDMVQRILLHRTQEFEGADAKIGIPMGFKMNYNDENATFEYQESSEDEGSSYCDFYYLNKFRTLQRDKTKDIEVGDRVELIFLGKPVRKVLKEEGNLLTLEGTDEQVLDSNVVNVDRNRDLEVGEKVTNIYDEDTEREYRCEVVAVGEETIQVKVLRHQGYPDDLIMELSKIKVTMEKDAFKELFKSFEKQLFESETPKQLIQNIVKYLGRQKLRLSKNKKEDIKSMKNDFNYIKTELDDDIDIFQDLKSQEKETDDNTDMSGVKLLLKDEDMAYFGFAGKPKKAGWFDDNKSTEQILPAFLKCVKIMTTLQSMEKALMSSVYITERVKKTIEFVVGRRPRVKETLVDSYEMQLDMDILEWYARESLERVDYEGNFLEEEVKRRVDTIQDFFLEVQDVHNENGDEKMSDFNTDDEDDTEIAETNASSHSYLNESNLVQWPVGEFQYWPKVSEVFDILVERQEAFIITRRQNAQPSSESTKASSVFLNSSNDRKFEKVFRSRLACMLTSNGRAYLESYFEQGRLPPRKELEEMYAKLRLGLNDIFLVLLFKNYIKRKKKELDKKWRKELDKWRKELNEGERKELECITQLDELVADLLQTFFSGLRVSFIDDTLTFTDKVFKDDRIRLSSTFFQPLLLQLSREENQVEAFKGRLLKQVNGEGYSYVCLRFKSEITDGEPDARLQYYLKCALQVGIYMTKHCKTSRQSSELFFDLLKFLLLNNTNPDYTKLDSKKKKELAKKKKDLEALLNKDTAKLKTCDTKILKNLFLKQTAKNKDNRERRAQYHRDRRDAILVKWVNHYLKEVKELGGVTVNRKQFHMCDALISLIAISCVASFEHSNIDYTLQTLLVNFIERGTVDLGTYTQMWYFHDDKIENHWVRCKDKTTIEVLSVCRFAEITPKSVHGSIEVPEFCLFNANNWDDLTESSIQLFTPNSTWGVLKGYNCNQHNLYMSYDVQTTQRNDKGGVVKDIQNFNTMHNPISLHTQHAQSMQFSPFQHMAFQQKKMTGISWSIGDLFGQSVVHLGSTFFLTFNNIFGCFANKNFMPFEKFKQIADSKDDLQHKMYDMFLEVYKARRYKQGINQKDITREDMKKIFSQNVGFIKSNYNSLDIDKKLPRHNYVVRVSEFLEILKDIETLPPSSGDKHLPFLQKVCDHLLGKLTKKEARQIGATNYPDVILIKKIGEMFHSDKDNIQSDIWRQNYKWDKNKEPQLVEAEPFQPFRIQRLVELVLLVDFATIEGAREYRYRFHERLNKLTLAFSYMFSKEERAWAKRHTYLEKMRRKNVSLNCSHFYVALPQCRPLIDLTSAMCPLQNFNQNLQSIVTEFFKIFKFNMHEKDDAVFFSLSYENNRDDIKIRINTIRQMISNFTGEIELQITTDIENERGFFINIGDYKNKLEEARGRLQDAKDGYKKSKSNEFTQEFTKRGETPVWETIISEMESEFLRQKRIYDTAKEAQGKPLYDFLHSLKTFEEFLRLSTEGTGENDTEDLNTDEEELYEDILEALKFPYIQQKYGNKLIFMLSENIFLNAGIAGSFAEKIMSSLSKRLNILEDDENPDDEKLSDNDKLKDEKVKIKEVNDLDKDSSDLAESLAEANLSELTATMRDLHDALFDYFDDFDSTPFLSSLLRQKFELQRLYNRFLKSKPKENVSEVLTEGYKQRLGELDFYIQLQEFIVDLRNSADPYSSIGTKLYTAVQQGKNIKVKEIFTDDQKDQKESLEAILKIKPKTTVDNEKLKIPLVNHYAMALRAFVYKKSISEILSQSTEDILIEVNKSKLQTLQPQWFESMKISVDQKLKKYKDYYTQFLDDELDYSPEVESFRDMTRLWRSIKRPNNYKLFIRFCQKVMKVKEDAIRQDIAESIRGEENNIKSFFCLYFKGEGLFQELVPVRYASDWWKQFQRNFTNAILTEHRLELNDCLDKLSEVRFPTGFKVFYNSLVDAYRKNPSVKYLFKEMEPFIMDIEIGGISVDLDLPMELHNEWLTKMISELREKIEDIDDGQGTSTDNNFSVVIGLLLEVSESTFKEFLDRINIFTNSKKGELINIILAYKDDINRHTNITDLQDEDGVLTFKRSMTPNTPSSSSSSGSSSSSSSSGGSGGSNYSDSSVLSSGSAVSSSQNDYVPSPLVDSPSRPDNSSDVVNSSDVNITLFSQEQDGTFDDVVERYLMRDNPSEVFRDNIDDPYKAYTRVIAMFQEDYEESQKKTGFVKAMGEDISIFLSQINPDLNDDIVYDETFLSAMKDLASLLKVFFSFILKDSFDPEEFLKELENIEVLSTLKYLIYREDNTTKSIYNDIRDFFSEIIAGEFSWKVWTNNNTKNRKLTLKTFRSYYFEEKEIIETVIERLREYERFYGVREPFLVRLSEVQKERKEANEETKETNGEIDDFTSKIQEVTVATVYTLHDTFLESIQTAFLVDCKMDLDNKEFKLDKTEFENPVIKFKDIINFYVYSAKEQDNPTNKPLKKKIAKIVKIAYEDTKSLLDTKLDEKKKEFSDEQKEKFKEYMEETIKKILLQYCKFNSEEKHYFIWRTDLKGCKYCGKDILDEIHNLTMEVEANDELIGLKDAEVFVEPGVEETLIDEKLLALLESVGVSDDEE